MLPRHAAALVGSPRLRRMVGLGLLLGFVAAPAAAQPARTVDLATVPGTGSDLFRAFGSVGTGAFGVPVAGPYDVDGDGHTDSAIAAMTASTAGGPSFAQGEVFLVFGDGTLAGQVDTAVTQSRVLRFLGDQAGENAGSEIWIDDVTGDGLGDLLIARQDYTPAVGREGAGALSIIVGDADLATFAATLATFDLASPPASVNVTTLLGANDRGRFGIWMRTGDATGDGIADILIGADQVTENSENHRGRAWLIRGGSHLNANQTVDLVDFTTTGTALAGDILRIEPETGSAEYHFGGTVSIGDLDANGRDELMVAATLNRAGAVLSNNNPGTHASGGPTDGTMYIVWDDNVPVGGAGTWASGLTIDLDSPSGSVTRIDGGVENVNFGEEMLGGEDYDGDGTADLYVGDLTGDGTGGSRFNSGLGHVLFDAATLKTAGTVDMDSPPVGLVISTFLGAEFGDISGDTALHGDFDGDGIVDLAITAPHATPPGRPEAGIVYVLHGQSQPWPVEVDLLPANFPAPNVFRITQIDGAMGQSGADAGDVLGYSASAGDMNGDGRDDLVLNEMQGNGVLPAAEDAGNLIIISGFLIGPPAVPAVPPLAAGTGAACLLALGVRLFAGRRRA